MDAEVVEIPPPVPRSSKPQKQKQAFVHEVINIDDDEDSADPAIIEKELNKLKKGKAVMDVSNGHLNGYSEEGLADHIFIPPDDLVGAINGTELQGLEEGSHTSFNVDGQIYDFPAYDDDYMDYILEDPVYINDDYDLLQAHFDNMDIPPGVEAPVPWLAGASTNEKKSNSGNGVHSSGSLHAGPAAAFVNETGFFTLTGPPPTEMKATFTSTSGSHGQANSVGYPPQVDLSTPWLSTQSVQSKKNRAGSQRKGSSRGFSFGLESFKSRRLLDPLKNKKSPVPLGNPTNISLPGQFSVSAYPYGVDPSNNWNQGIPPGVNMQPVPVSSSHTSVPLTVSGSSSYPSFPQQIFAQNKPSAEPFNMWLKDSTKYSVNHAHAYPATYSHVQPLSPSVYTLPEEEGDSQLPQSSSGNRANDIADVLRKFETFKHFDTVQDHSDHHYSGHGSALKQPSKSWARRIQEEWKSLEKDLPDTIFVRVYETRMDLLRAVIVGAEGTPYHDGLFFFDVFFPSNYPNTPPLVYYHSRGLRLNPNLYACGKVCLSLLNTWTGRHKNEKWMPGVSTTLQVLVSIQGLILNAKPYFNEPGFESSRGSKTGEHTSLRYNEDTFILSLKTMTYMVRTPPKHFEDFVTGHFFRRAQDILMACKAYMEGAQVGCLVKGGVQDVDAGNKGCSNQFKQCLSGYIGILAKAFIKIGVKDCEKFLTPAPAPAPTVKEIKRQVGGVTIIEHLD